MTPLSWMGFDVETSGSPHDYALQPWRVAQGTAWVTSTVAIDPTRKLRFDAQFQTGDVVASMRAMLEHASAHDMTIVGWNVMFDIQWLIAYDMLDLAKRVRWLDGMLIWKHAVLEPEGHISATKRFTFGLKECVRVVLPQYAGYEDGVDFHTTQPEEVARLHAYNVRDVQFTLACARYWWLRLNDRQRATALIEADSLVRFALANYTGIKIDTLKAREISVANRAAANRELRKLAVLGGTSEVLSSPVKLAKLIFDDWGVQATKFTATGGRSTDKEVLTELAVDDPRVASVLTWRKARNSATKFAEAPLEAARYNGDGMARPQAKPFGTATARLTYASNQRGLVPGARPGTWKQGNLQTGWALHQMQRDRMYRQLALAPEGYTLVEFDAAGQEFRWMALLSGDNTMLKLCSPGEDAHAYMGAQIAHISYDAFLLSLHDKTRDVNAVKHDKNIRQLGKVANLSMQYRTSSKTLRTVAKTQYAVQLTEHEAEHISTTYKRSYPGVPRYWTRQIEFGRQNGYVENLAGRRIRLRGNWMARGSSWALESATINWPIQSIGAEQKYLALMQTGPIVEAYDARFAWDLHDGLYFYVPTTNTNKFIIEMKETLDNLDYEKHWGYVPSIPLPFDAKVGSSWGAMEEVPF